MEDDIAKLLRKEEERLEKLNHAKQSGLFELDVLVSGRKRDMTAFREAYQRSMLFLSPKHGSPTKSPKRSASKPKFELPT